MSDDAYETGRRVRAAMAYANVSREQAADVLDVSIATLNRITTTRGEPRRVDLRDLWRLADACHLPPEWFSADLSRLPEIVPPGMPTVVRSPAEGQDPSASDLPYRPIPRPRSDSRQRTD